MKLRNRLSTIRNQILDDYHHIWDCCCDHGYLGRQLMLEHCNSEIHFVDVAPHLTQDIEESLKKQSLKNWRVHCINAAEITLTTSQKHLVIIAGVGGDLLIKMVKHIISQNSDLVNNGSIDFILCPVRQLHKVRRGLNEAKLGLVSENIVKENNLYYEVIHVSNQSNQPINLVGDVMWDLSNPDHLSYQQTMIHHFEKQPNNEAQRIVSLYKLI